MDEFLLNLLLTNPEKGLKKLIDTYAGLVYTIIYSKLNSRLFKEDIEECSSAVFYEVFKNRNSIDLNKGSLKAFIAVIAKRKAIDVIRRNKNIADSVVSMEQLNHDLSTPKEEYAETIVMNKETKSIIIDSIKSLGEPDSEIFIRKYFFGQSTKIVSKILGIKENTIDKKVSRGLIKLRKILKEVL
ncbi:sigma-70 family RNA polymerase sigma factor [Herbivorax sp. ANBcel31]|uniref:RNA polymerase sigma factor n=1 Tax=Herbivorax sp. ANBcel31 TaxID=3069754 RepID=UPI0027AE6621|nr:sigma-70 family RNA polymerase sigma factor [Herbivorax sp. ANBcel31]MDQ2085165.1 sigma-70 family RNA polymerase sigma factor [Herbivorax sp. ANBcel31]